jgi:hypothetical protein
LALYHRSYHVQAPEARFRVSDPSTRAAIRSSRAGVTCAYMLAAAMVMFA